MEEFASVEPAGVSAGWLSTIFIGLPLVGWLFAGSGEFRELKTEVINTRIKVGKLEGKMEVLLSTMQRVEVKMTNHNASSNDGTIKQAGNQIIE